MVIAKIYNVFKNLTDTEQKIASYILEFPEKVVNMTAKELADTLKNREFEAIIPY